MYERGYNDALTQLGLHSIKTARPAPIKALKGLLGGAKTKAQAAMGHFKRKPAVGLPKAKPGQAPSDAQTNANIDMLRGGQQSPGDFAPWGTKAPAPAQASGINQFEAKMRNATPPPGIPKMTDVDFKRPAPVPAGQVPAAPPKPAAVPAAKPAVNSAEASAEVLKNAPKVPDKKPGLLRRGAKWALPAAAIGGGVYAGTRPDNPEMTPLPQQAYGAQYAPQYASAVPYY